MDAQLEQALNLLLESERAGVIALDALIADVKQDELKKFLSGSRAMEQRNAEELETLIRNNDGKPSTAVGPFARKAAALGSIRDRLNLMSRGQEWAARKTEVALALAPADGPIHDCLTAMANRHRAEVEWGRAEVIRLTNLSS
ncbi:MAG: DUF6306 domain-containing protein [Candidatus Binatus sp.]|uniref:DUF6306 domain-containing protein n=1 Tax=Candidatus Binatus sp. TaxID=2811406 RepID=UPI003BAF35F2